MAVTAAVIYDHTGGFTISDQVVRSYTIVYRITSDTQTDGSAVCLRALPTYYPNAFSYYYITATENDPRATVKSATCTRVDPESMLPYFAATVTYDTTPRGTSDSDNPMDDTVTAPWQEPATWSGSFFTAQKTADRWADGTGIVNSASEPMNFDIDDSRLSIICSKNLQTLDVVGLEDKKDGVNNAAHWGFGKGKLKVMRFDWSQSYFKGTKYYPCTVEIHVNPDGWDVDFVDEGYSEIIAGSTVTILDDTTKLPVAERYPLNGAGRKLSPKTDPRVLFPNPKKHVYPQISFSTLGIPNTLLGD